jgi:hypothetical protein
MANNIRCDQVIERIRLTAVPGVEETPDYGLVLLCRCAHGEPPSLLSFACTWTGAPSLSRHPGPRDPLLLVGPAIPGTARQGRPAGEGTQGLPSLTPCSCPDLYP